MDSVNKLAGMLVHNMLRPDCTLSMLKDGCEAAIAWGLHGVCVRSCDTDDARRLLRDSGVKLFAAAGFPHGGCDMATKVYEAQKAVDDGADGVIAVMNTGRLLSEKYDYCEQEQKAVVLTSNRKGVPVFALAERCFLPEKFFKSAVLSAISAGVSGLATASGYGTEGALERDMTAVRELAGRNIKCLALGGVKSLDQAVSLISAGADLVFSAVTGKIIDEADARQREGAILFPAAL